MTRFSRRDLLKFSALTAFAGGGYSFLVEPSWMRLRTYDLKSSKWPAEFGSLTIAFASDFHVGCPSVGLEETDAIVQKLNALNADIIILGGDYLVSGLLLGRYVQPHLIAPILGQLKAPLGVYAVLGNHDWYKDGQGMWDALEKNGIKVLENSALKVVRDQGSFWIAGLADDETRTPDLDKTMAQIDNDAPVIMVAHDPASFIDMNDRPVVTLCGHTHGGQVVIPYVTALVIPGRAPLKYAYGHVAEQGRDLIISSGLGTSILPVRFGRRPEIVKITIENAGGTALS